MVWHISAIRMFVQQLVHTDNKEKIKSSYLWRFVKGIHRWSVVFSNKGFVKRKTFFMMVLPGNSDVRGCFGQILATSLRKIFFVTQREGHKTFHTNIYIYIKTVVRMYIHIIKVQLYPTKSFATVATHANLHGSMFIDLIELIRMNIGNMF